MSITFTDLPETNFPDEIDPITRMSDLSADNKALADQYYTYISAGNFAAAQALLTANPSLDTMIHNAAKYNKNHDGLVAVQRFLKNMLQDYLTEQFTYIGTYAAGTTYVKNNIVDYSGESFICRVATSVGTSPTAHSTTTNWACISKQGIQGVSGTGLAPRGIWNSSTTYVINDCVSYGNILWQCLTGNTNSVPTVSNPKWVAILNLTDSSTSVITFTEAGTRANISTGETLAIILGKIKKYLTDLGAAAFSGLGTTATEIGLSSSGGSATTLSKSDHTHKDRLVSVTSNTSTAAPLEGQGFTCVGDITTDEYGRVTVKTQKTVTFPNNRVPTTTTVNGHPLSSNVSVTASDVGLGNVTNESKSTMFGNPTFTGTMTLPTTVNTESEAGYSMNTFGNIKHRRNTSTDDFAISNYAGNAIFKVNYESGDVTFLGELTINPNVYGTSLPAAGTVGRVFYKKV